MAGMTPIVRATRIARRAWPIAVELWRRWDRLPPKEKERYRRAAGKYAERGRGAAGRYAERGRGAYRSVRGRATRGRGRR